MLFHSTLFYITEPSCSCQRWDFARYLESRPLLPRGKPSWGGQGWQRAQHPTFIPSTTEPEEERQDSRDGCYLHGIPATLVRAWNRAVVPWLTRNAKGEFCMWIKRNVLPFWISVYSPMDKVLNWGFFLLPISFFLKKSKEEIEDPKHFWKIQ